MNSNFTYITKDQITNIQNNIYSNITSENLSKYTDHILHEANFNYRDVNDLRKYKDTHVNLGEILRNFSINEKFYSRYETPQMPTNISIEQLKSRRKLHVLEYRKNKADNSRGKRLSRVYTNTNMKHPSYTSQSKDGVTNFNIKNLKRVNNSLIYTGQQLNKIRTQTLSSNNGGNLRSKTQNNYRITTNPNDPLIGIRRKITHHEISKHDLVKQKLPIL